MTTSTHESQSTTEETGGWSFVGQMAVSAVLWILSARWAAQIVDPVLIYGGTSCTDTGMIQSCVGYLPAGLLILLFASIIGVRILWAAGRIGVDRAMYWRRSV